MPEEILQSLNATDLTCGLTDAAQSVDGKHASWASHPTVLEEIRTARELIDQLGGLNIQQILDRLKDHSGRFLALSLDKERSSMLAAITAWLCGTLLNWTKKQKGHKAFGKWRTEHLVPAVMCERSTQRHMAMAKKYQTIDELITAGDSHSAAATNSGEEPEAKAPPQVTGGKSKPKSKVFSCIRGLENSLRLLEASNEKLDQDELGELRLMKGQLDALFKQVCSVESPESEAAP